MEEVRSTRNRLIQAFSGSPVHNAFPLDLLGFSAYTFPPGRRGMPISILDPLEGTETNQTASAYLPESEMDSNSSGILFLRTAASCACPRE
jgi:hypothetical protein